MQVKINLVMKTILVPTDFSKNAGNALRYAISIANKMQAKIILLHSFHIDYANSYVPVNLIEKEVDGTKANSNERLKELYNKVSHHSKHPIECISNQNLVVDAILAVAAEKDADLIVMGTQGVNGMLSRQIFGTNSSKVIEKAMCPVLTIPENTIHTDIKKIMYATEYLDSDITCLKAVADLAKLFEAEIQVIHISLYENETASEKKLKEEFRFKAGKNISYKNISFQLLEGHNIEQKIETHIDEAKDIDMLVMSAHHRNLRDKLFGRSITKEMAFYTKIPLMVFHHKRNKSDDESDHVLAKLLV